MKLLGLLSDWCEKIAVVVSAFLLVAVFFLVFGGVCLRMSGYNFSMSEELSRWGLVSICFVGASAALKQKMHVAVNMLVDMLPLNIGKIVVAITYVLVIILLVYSTGYSWKAAMRTSLMTGDIIPLSMMWVKLMLPFGMAMMLVHLVHGLLSIPSSKDLESIHIGT
jgi:TRAP-type C4-dicarboxylate transport system permease small subunit